MQKPSCRRAAGKGCELQETALHQRAWAGREATGDTKQQCQPGHELRGRAQAPFPSPTVTGTPLPFLSQQAPPVTAPVKIVLHPPINSLRMSTSPGWGLGKANLGQVGGQPPAQPLSQQDIWGTSGLSARDKKGLSFIVYHLQYSDRRKRFVRGTVYCALHSRVAGPLEPWL